MPGADSPAKTASCFIAFHYCRRQISCLVKLKTPDVTVHFPRHSNVISSKWETPMSAEIFSSSSTPPPVNIYHEGFSSRHRVFPFFVLPRVFEFLLPHEETRGPTFSPRPILRSMSICTSSGTHAMSQSSLMISLMVGRIRSLNIFLLSSRSSLPIRRGSSLFRWCSWSRECLEKQSKRKATRLLEAWQKLRTQCMN